MQVYPTIRPIRQGATVLSWVGTKLESGQSLGWCAHVKHPLQTHCDVSCAILYASCFRMNGTPSSLSPSHLLFYRFFPNNFPAILYPGATSAQPISTTSSLDYKLVPTARLQADVSLGPQGSSLMGSAAPRQMTKRGLPIDTPKNEDCPSPQAGSVLARHWR